MLCGKSTCTKWNSPVWLGIFSIYIPVSKNSWLVANLILKVLAAFYIYLQKAFWNLIVPFRTIKSLDMLYDLKVLIEEILSLQVQQCC